MYQIQIRFKRLNLTQSFKVDFSDARPVIDDFKLFSAGLLQLDFDYVGSSVDGVLQKLLHRCRDVQDNLLEK
jgi:hypothetical protein